MAAGFIRELIGQDLNAILIALVLAVVTQLLSVAFVRRPKLVYYKTEEAFALLGNVQVRVQTLVIQNLGNQEARDIQVIHNWPEATFNWDIQPPRQCQKMTLPGGQAGFRIEVVQPYETVFITYVYSTPPNQNPVLSSVLLAGHKAATMMFPLANRYSRLLIWARRVLVFIGGWVVFFVLLSCGIALWHLIT